MPFAWFASDALMDPGAAVCTSVPVVRVRSGADVAPALEARAAPSGCTGAPAAELLRSNALPVATCCALVPAAVATPAPAVPVPSEPPKTSANIFFKPSIEKMKGKKNKNIIPKKPRHLYPRHTRGQRPVSTLRKLVAAPSQLQMHRPCQAGSQQAG